MHTLALGFLFFLLPTVDATGCGGVHGCNECDSVGTCIEPQACAEQFFSNCGKCISDSCIECNPSSAFILSKTNGIFGISECIPCETLHFAGCTECTVDECTKTIPCDHVENCDICGVVKTEFPNTNKICKKCSPLSDLKRGDLSGIQNCEPNCAANGEDCAECDSDNRCIRCKDPTHYLADAHPLKCLDCSVHGNDCIECMEYTDDAYCRLCKDNNGNEYAPTEGKCCGSDPVVNGVVNGECCSPPLYYQELNYLSGDIEKRCLDCSVFGKGCVECSIDEYYDADGYPQDYCSKCEIGDPVDGKCLTWDDFDPQTQSKVLKIIVELRDTWDVANACIRPDAAQNILNLCPAGHYCGDSGLHQYVQMHMLLAQQEKDACISQCDDDNTCLSICRATYNYDINALTEENNRENQYNIVKECDNTNYVHLKDWNVSQIEDFSNMFTSKKINKPLLWNVSKATNMKEMFQYAKVFNQPLNAWDTSRVTSMERMFYRAESFNQPLFLWDVENVKDMTSMFEGASAFNQPLHAWRPSSVDYFKYMFKDATSYNQPTPLCGDWTRETHEYRTIYPDQGWVYTEIPKIWCLKVNPETNEPTSQEDQWPCHEFIKVKKPCLEFGHKIVQSFPELYNHGYERRYPDPGSAMFGYGSDFRDNSKMCQCKTYDPDWRQIVTRDTPYQKGRHMEECCYTVSFFSEQAANQYKAVKCNGLRDAYDSFTDIDYEDCRIGGRVNQCCDEDECVRIYGQKYAVYGSDEFMRFKNRTGRNHILRVRISLEDVINGYYAAEEDTYVYGEPETTLVKSSDYWFIGGGDMHYDMFRNVQEGAVLNNVDNEDLGLGNLKDQFCMVCPPGTHYQPDPNAAETYTNTGKCVLCSPGKYNPGSGSPIDAGINIVSGNPKLTTDCWECPYGKYNDLSGATSCNSCPVGKYLPKSWEMQYDNDAAEQALKACSADGDPAAVQDCEATAGAVLNNLIDRHSRTIKATECFDVPEGKMTLHDTHGHWGQVWSVDRTNPEQSRFVTLFDPCPAGTFAGTSAHPVESERDCLDFPYSRCEYIDANGITGWYVWFQNTECSNCPNGKVSNVSSTDVSDCKECNHGQYAESYSTEGVPLVSDSCYLCPKGTYADTYENTNSAACKRCDYGKSTESVGSTKSGDCFDCPKGKYSRVGQNDEWDQGCVECPAGQFGRDIKLFKKKKGDAVLPVTEDDYWEPDNDWGCTKCVAGKFSNPGAIGWDSGEDECYSCWPGMYNDEDGGECKKCPAGRATFPAEQSARNPMPISCIACELSDYNTEEGQEYCKCPPGYDYEYWDAEGFDFDGFDKYGFNKEGIHKVTKGLEDERGFIGKKIFSEPYTAWFERYTNVWTYPFSNYDSDGWDINGFTNQGYYKDTTPCTDCSVARDQNGWDVDGKDADGIQRRDVIPETACVNKCSESVKQACLDADRQVCSSGSSECGPLIPCQPGSYRGDNGCEQCTAGKYSDTAGQSFCNVCAEGKYNEQTGSTTASACKDCAEGKYNPNTGSATDCQSCGEGKYNPNTKSVSEAECQTCPKGYFSHPGYGIPIGRSSCTACQKNYYQDQIGQGSCKICPGGTLGNIVGATTEDDCQEFSCPDGQFVHDYGHTKQCNDCGQGRYLTENGLTYFNYGGGTHPCRDCEPGTYMEDRGAVSSCTVCPTGYSNGEERGVYCTECRGGKYNDVVGQEQCKECPEGRYEQIYDEYGYEYRGSVTEERTCKTCPAGYFKPNAGSATCESCGLGKYLESEGAEAESQCKLCEKGKYGDKVGSAGCESCGTGKYLDSEGAATETQCKTCDGGSADWKDPVSGHEQSRTYYEYSDSLTEAQCKKCPYGFITSSDSAGCKDLCSQTIKDECAAANRHGCTSGSEVVDPQLLAECYYDNTGPDCNGLDANLFVQCDATTPRCWEDYQPTCGGCLPGFESDADGNCVGICEKGTYGDGSGGCKSCETGKYLDFKGAVSESQCKTCDNRAVFWKDPVSGAGMYRSYYQYSESLTEAQCKTCPYGFTASSAACKDLCSQTINDECAAANRHGCTSGSDVVDPTRLAECYWKVTLGAPWKLWHNWGSAWFNKSPDCDGLDASLFVQCDYSCEKDYQPTCGGCLDGFESDADGNCADINTLCGKGKYGDVSDCKSCETGKYLDFIGATSESDCKTCGEGRYNPNTASELESDCKDCDPGTYNAEAAAAACEDCDPGTYNAEAAAAACEICGNGRYNPDTASELESDCKDCDPGTYNAEAAAAACENCGNGRYNPDTASELESDCKTCDGGRVFWKDPVSGAGMYRSYYQYSESLTEAQCKKCPYGFITSSDSAACKDLCSQTIKDECAAANRHGCTSGSDVVDPTRLAECYWKVTLGSPWKLWHNTAGYFDKSPDCDGLDASLFVGCDDGTPHCWEDYQPTCGGCLPGWLEIDTNGNCADINTLCEKGKYGDGSDCKSCETGKYLDFIGATSKSDCKTCDGGRVYWRDPISGYGMSRPNYEYSDSLTEAQCKTCPYGFITSSDSAACKDLCSQTMKDECAAANRHGCTPGSEVVDPQLLSECNWKVNHNSYLSSLDQLRGNMDEDDPRDWQHRWNQYPDCDGLDASLFVGCLYSDHCWENYQPTCGGCLDGFESDADGNCLKINTCNTCLDACQTADHAVVVERHYLAVTACRGAEQDGKDDQQEEEAAAACDKACLKQRCGAEDADALAQKHAELAVKKKAPDCGACSPGCSSWFDGCNTCSCADGKLGACTEKACSEYEAAKCLDYDPCEGKGDDETCTLCDPLDSSCVETAVVKTCQSGQCKASNIVTIVFGSTPKTITACTGDTVEVTWNGNHNIQEIKSETCDEGENKGEQTEGYHHLDDEGNRFVKTYSNNELTASPGEVRYFKCSLHCQHGARFTVSCPTI